MARLNVLLAKTDLLGVRFKNSIKDYLIFLKDKQGAFKGIQSTYEKKGDAADEPNRRSVILVQTTVEEKLTWFADSNSEYLDALFAQEATNAGGSAKAELIIGEESWGEFSTLELLRLKSILENGELKKMYGKLPTRSDARQWRITSSELYENRTGIYEAPIVPYDNNTSETESFIVPDPNLKQLGEGANYTPMMATRKITRILGTGTNQDFTGMFSHRERAEILSRINKLHVACVEALKKANEVEAIPSLLSAKKIFSYLHGK